MSNITKDDNIISANSKNEALDFIMSNCFKSGFGALSKTDIDLILFTAILKYSDDNKKSDFELSKYLQITQQRIRNLREKASVKYPTLTRSEAIDEFLEKCEFSKVEETYIDIPINNIVIKNEIEAMLDDANILLHSQLNPKIFRLRINDFYELSILLELYNNKNLKKKDIEQKIIKQIKTKAKKDNDFKKRLEDGGWNLKDLTASTLKESLLKGGLSLGVEALASFLPGGAFLSGPAQSFLYKISEKV